MYILYQTTPHPPHPTAPLPSPPHCPLPSPLCFTLLTGNVSGPQGLFEGARSHSWHAGRPSRVLLCIWAAVLHRWVLERSTSISWQQKLTYFYCNCAVLHGNACKIINSFVICFTEVHIQYIIASGNNIDVHTTASMWVFHVFMMTQSSHGVCMCRHDRWRGDDAGQV